ncbi:hypothetical protein J3D55_002602 [Chryseobacterium ginsenosidimutans]|uniref:hypothetical protein n=1 Tax=Chryseobacterium ginsenosidimutans TaxID=687846 RepID=UPI002169DFC4|nr:hypothetical protein [Chryseobacterium ginsenosidimutans]MCS3869686.1 hypothetical protein [Chryseobacterium ginsenosidimutans]
MKNIIQILILAVILFSCNKEKNTQTISSVQKNIIDIKSLKYFEVGYQDKFEILPPLEFSEITKDEYDNLKSTSNSITNSPLPIKDNNYLLEINNKILKLKTEENVAKEGENKYEYLGFYPTLNIYAFSANSSRDNLGFSELELINKFDFSAYRIISVGDDKVEKPIISPQTKYLVYRYNYVYETNKSFLGVLKINDDKTFTEHRSFSSNNFNIAETIWLGDDYVGIKTTYDKGKTYKYHKANLAVNENNKPDTFKGNYSVYIETEATTTGMASISYSFKIQGNEAILETNTYHEPIRCNGKYLIKSNNNILELYYNDEEIDCKADSPAFYIKKEGGKYFIKGIGGEATFNEWILLERKDN